MTNVHAPARTCKVSPVSPLRRARAHTLTSYGWVDLGTCVELNPALYAHLRAKFGWSLRVIDQAINDAALLNLLSIGTWACHGDVGIRVSLNDTANMEADPWEAW